MSIGYSIPDYTVKDLKPSAVDSMFPPEDILDLQGYLYPKRSDQQSYTEMQNSETLFNIVYTYSCGKITIGISATV